MSDQLPVHKRPKDDTHDESPPPPPLLVDLPPPPLDYTGIFAHQTHDNESKEAQHMSVSAFAQHPSLNNDIAHDTISASLPASPASALDPLHPSSALDSDEEMFIAAPPTVGADEPNAMGNTISEAMPSSADDSEEMCEPGFGSDGDRKTAQSRRAQLRPYRKMSEKEQASGDCSAQDDEEKEAFVPKQNAEERALTIKKRKATRFCTTQLEQIQKQRQKITDMQGKQVEQLVEVIGDVDERVHQITKIVNDDNAQIQQLKLKLKSVHEKSRRDSLQLQAVQSMLLAQVQQLQQMLIGRGMGAARGSISEGGRRGRSESFAMQSVIEGADQAETKQDDE